MTDYLYPFIVLIPALTWFFWCALFLAFEARRRARPARTIFSIVNDDGSRSPVLDPGGRRAKRRILAWVGALVAVQAASLAVAHALTEAGRTPGVEASARVVQVTKISKIPIVPIIPRTAASAVRPLPPLSFRPTVRGPGSIQQALREAAEESGGDQSPAAKNNYRLHFDAEPTQMLPKAY